MSAILGLRDVQSLDADARPGSWEETVYNYWRSHRPFMAMMSRLGNRKPVTDPEHNVFEQGLPVRRVYVNNGAGYSSTDTLLTVDDGSGTSGMAKYLRAGMVLVVGTDPATGELLQVSEDPTSETQITVLRGQFGSTAASLTNNDALTILYDASAEGANVPTAVTEEPVLRTNYIGVIQTAWHYTTTMQKTKTRYGQDEPNRQRSMALWNHSMDLELALLYGRKGYKTDPITGTRVRTTGGLAYWMTLAGVNVLDASGANFTIANWYAYVQGITHGSDQKVFMMGQTLYASLHDLAREEGSIQITPYENKYGFKLKRMTSAGPELLLMVHPLLTELFPGDGFLLDLPVLKYLYMQKTAPKKVVVGNTVLREVWVYLTQMGLQFVHPKAFGYVKGNTIFTPPA